MLCLELLDRMYFKGSLERASFSISNGSLTLPWFFSGVIGIAFNRVPCRIMNQWWEVLPLGPGIQQRVYNRAIDAGSGFVVFKDLADVDATGCYLKVISDVPEAESDDMLIHLKGLDVNAEELRTLDTNEEYIDGEKVEIASTAHWTLNKFTTLQQAIKPETNGRIRIYASATSGDASPTLVAIYQPTETNPSWRRYRMPSNSDSSVITVEALCQVEHRWVSSDDDPLSIGSFPALVDGVMALHAKDQGDKDRHDELMDSAVRKLNYEHKRYHPDSTRVTPVQVFDETTKPIM